MEISLDEMIACYRTLADTPVLITRRVLAIGLSVAWSTQDSSPFTIDMGRKSTRHASALSLHIVYQTPEDDCRCAILDFGQLPSYWPMSLCLHR